MKYLILAVSCLAIGGLKAQQPAYKNAALPVEQRVADLLKRMTPEEKFWQCFMIPGEIKPGDEAKYKAGIFGFQVSAESKGGEAAQQLLQYNAKEDAVSLARKINGIQKYFMEQSRLGIPIIAFDEALHGLVRSGATAFPQAIALASTWDTSLMSKVANAIALETKLRGIRQILSPVINLAHDVRWGRTEETYGEDPYLSAVMGVSFIGAFERMGVVTSPKHFAFNVGAGGRDSYPIDFSQQFLLETELIPFKAVFEKAGARSVMTAYNSINGQAATANNWLLNDLLKKQWGFKGFVISDAGAVGGALVLHKTAKDYPESSQQAISNGLDVIFQTDYAHHPLFMPPFVDGRIPQTRIDDAVRRILRIKFELGLFENPYVDEKAIETLIDIAAHKQLAEEAAAKSFVLLKNEKLLPLRRLPASIALIGTDAAEGRLGGYSGPGNGIISIKAALEQKWTATKINYADGYERMGAEFVTIPAAQLFHNSKGKTVPGLLGEYFDQATISGAPKLTRVDKQVQFKWTLYAPDPSLRNDFYAVRWTGEVLAPETGTFKIGLEGNDGFRLYINGKLVVDNWSKQSFSLRTTDVQLEKGKRYPIKIEFREPVGNAAIRLVWNAGHSFNWQEKIAAAVAAAQQSEVAIIVAGIHEGEFQDRAYLSLPGHQEELIQAVAATGKRVVVLLVGGSAITMQNWMDKVDAIAQIWYPGEQGGLAVADLLSGRINPAGRLPITFPVHEAQLPLTYYHKPTGRGDDYHNLSGEPLFPFGYGLSYTEFKYSNLRVLTPTIGSKDTAVIQCVVTNVGPVAGEEVVQLYIRDELASLARPVMQLKGFERISLLKGESRTVKFRLPASELAFLNQQLETVLEPGSFRIMIGASSRDIRLKGDLELK